MPTRNYSQELLDALNDHQFERANEILDDVSINNNLDLSLRSDHRGYTALHYAVLRNQVDITRKLLRLGADTRIKSYTLWFSNLTRTPLEKAVVENKWDIVAVFAEFPTRTPGQSSYHFAVNEAILIKCSNAHPQKENVPDGLIAKLIQCGVNPLMRLSFERSYYVAGTGSSVIPASQVLLHHRVAAGGITALRACLQHPNIAQIINTEDNHRKTPLDYAHQLLSLGANFQRTQGRTGLKDIVEALMQAGATPNSQLLINEADKGNWGMVEAIIQNLQASARPANFENIERILLHIAVRQDTPSARAALTNALPITTKQSKTEAGCGHHYDEFPLSYAVRKQYWDVVRHLAKRPVVDSASTAEQAELAQAYGEALLAVLNFSNYDGTPKTFDKLSRASKIELAISLVDSGAICHLQDASGWTVLHHIVDNWLEAEEQSVYNKQKSQNAFTANASENLRLAVLAQKVRVISQSHTSFNTKTSNGKTPLALAFDQNKPTMVAFLLNSGATVDYSDLIFYAKQNRWQCLSVFILTRSVDQRNLKKERQLLKLAYLAKHAWPQQGTALAEIKEFIKFGVEKIRAEKSLTEGAWQSALGDLLHTLVGIGEKKSVSDIRYLCRMGANKAALADEGNPYSTPIVVAAKQGKWEYVQAMREYNGDQQASERGLFALAMMYAIMAKENDVVRAMLADNISTVTIFPLRELSSSGQNVSYLALDVAIESGNSDIVPALIESDRSPQFIERAVSGKTPLQRAFEKDDSVVINYLLDAGAAPNAEVALQAARVGKWKSLKTYMATYTFQSQSWNQVQLHELSRLAAEAHEFEFQTACDDEIAERTQLRFLTARSGLGMGTPVSSQSQSAASSTETESEHSDHSSTSDSSSTDTSDSEGSTRDSVSPASSSRCSVSHEVNTSRHMTELGFFPAVSVSPGERQHDVPSCRLFTDNLHYEDADGEGKNNCFFNAVRIHTDHVDANALRTLAADYLGEPEHLSVFQPLSGLTDDEYRSRITEIRDGEEPADSDVIEALRRQLNRPIIVLQDGAPIIPDNIEESEGEPIFVYFKRDANSYGAFRIEGSAKASDILNEIRLLALQDRIVEFDYHENEFYIVDKPEYSAAVSP